MILHKLYTSSKIRLVEFIRNVPPQRSKFSSFLNSGVKECYSIKQWPPLRHIGVFQLFLRNSSIGPFQPSLHPLWRFIGKLYADLITCETSHDSSAIFIQWLFTCSSEMGNLGWTSVVSQTRQDSLTLSVSVTVWSSSSMKFKPKWQFCSSTHPPCKTVQGYE